MADLLTTGAGWLASQLMANASQPVIYSRGGDSVEVTATRGNTEAEDVTANDQIVSLRIDDFIIDPADLILDGVITNPRPGDQIDAADGTFRVLPINGRPCYSKSGSRIRIHAKRIGD